MFCMLLSKHLEGYILEDIQQYGLDRIIIFDIKGRNEIGDISYKKLIVEIMGRHSNIILVDKTPNMILDSIKACFFRINHPSDRSSGSDTSAPPDSIKQIRLKLGGRGYLEKLDFNAGKIDKQIVNLFAGISHYLLKRSFFKLD